MSNIKLNHRYARLIENLNECPYNDTQIDHLGVMLDVAFNLLTEKQKEQFFADPLVLEAEEEAKEWEEED